MKLNKEKNGQRSRSILLRNLRYSEKNERRLNFIKTNGKLEYNSITSTLVIKFNKEQL